MSKDDSVHIRHMLDQSEKIARKVESKSRAEFDADENLRLALAHLIQTIGEAARRVSDETRGSHPEIPRKQIMGMRHKIVHDYMDVNEDILWMVAQEQIAPLIERLRIYKPEAYGSGMGIGPAPPPPERSMDGHLPIHGPPRSLSSVW